MKIYLDWLNSYIDHGLSVADLSHRLTMAGLELEGLEEVDLGKGRQAAVMELNVTPNRGYCLSHIGVAREISALTGQPCCLPEVEAALEAAMGRVPVAERIAVINEEAELCPRYTALVLENVRPGPSPEWLADRLRAVGLRPINNIVDITNYVLMEYGQPLHAFDAALLAGNRIVVRRARAGERFEALDGSVLTLEPDALVIADAEKPVALAGIMGGANSQVTADTRTVVLESACFDPATVRRGSKKYALRSDSSYRFERGVDIDTVVTASARAALLIRELAGGELCAGRIDVYPQPREKVRVSFRAARARKVIGADLAADTMLKLLEALGLNVAVSSSEEEYLIEIPHSRPTLKREIDLIEEVARLHGYEQIPVTRPTGALQPVRPTRTQSVLRDLGALMPPRGFREAVNYSFIDDAAAQGWLSAHGSPEAGVIPLENPISSELGTMRTSLVPGLIRTAAHNLNHGQKTVRLFEQGNVFFQEPDAAAACQIPCLAALAAGPYPASPWTEAGGKHDFYDLKGALEVLAEHLRVTLDFEPARRPMLDPEQAVDCRVAGETVGYCGRLHPDLARQAGLDREVFVFELNIARLVASLPEAIRFQPLARFPETYRDISLLVDRTVKSQEVRDLIRQASGPWISRVDLYDQFEGKKLETGKKSLTFALAFRSSEKTLTDEEVNPVFEKIVDTLSGQLGAKLRE